MLAVPDHADRAFPISRALPAVADHSRDGGWRAIAIFFAGSTVLAFLVPTVVTVLFPVVAVAIALLMLARARPVGVVEFALWLFIAAPFIRRVVDWRSGYHPNSLVLVAAPLVCLTGAVALGRAREVRPWVALAFMLASLAFVFAAIVGVVDNGISAAFIEIAQWVSPFFLGVLVLLAPVSRADLLRVMRRLARWGLLAVGTYGVVQFFLLPPWDAAWMRNVSNIVYSIGAPEPLQVRVFSLSSSPGPLAAVLGTLLILSLAMRKRAVDYVAIGVGVTALGLSQVRAAWLIFVVTLAVLALVRRVKVGKFVALVAVVLVGIISIGGPLSSTITDRFTQTEQAGSQDTSYQARTSFQAQQLPAALASAGGRGFGSSGTAVRNPMASTPPGGFANTDSGYLEELHVFGAVFGLLVLALTVIGASLSWRQSLRGDDSEDSRMMVALAATVVVVPVALYFGPSLLDVGGVLFWVVLALSGEANRVQASSRGSVQLTDGQRPYPLSPA